jgi:hypothetical protein
MFIKTKSKQTKLKNHVIVKRDGLLPLLVATDSLARDEERGGSELRLQDALDRGGGGSLETCMCFQFAG